MGNELMRYTCLRYVRRVCVYAFMKCLCVLHVREECLILAF